MIRAVGLEKRYGLKRVLRGLDFELERGGFLVVTGANGVGQDDAASSLCRPRDPDRRDARGRAASGG